MFLEEEVNDADPQEIKVLHDPENPKIVKGGLFPDIISFRKAIRHYAVTKGFEFAPGGKSDKTRFIAKCAVTGCPWRIHASRVQDNKTIQIKVLPADHRCATTKLRVGKMASQDGILPSVMKELNLISNNLKVVKVASSDDGIAEVTILDDWNNQRRHTADLENHKCSCREWQVTGKPCKHALAWICSNRGLQISNYVHPYYSVAMFRAAYEARVEPMPDRSQWPEVDLGFKVFPPLLGRPPGRPRVQRIRSCLENNPNKKKVKCKRCGNFGHFEKTCKNPEEGYDDQTAAPESRQTQEIGTAGTFQPPPSQAGPSQGTKRKEATAKKKTPKKKKTPTAPPQKVVRRLKDLLND